MRALARVVAVGALLVVTACAVRLGGRSPVEYEAIALEAPQGASAAAVAAQLSETGADLVLVSTPQDSGWLESVASGAGLTLSGPGRTSGRSLAFLSRLEILGDTSMVLDVPEGGRVHMHDALYKVDDDRFVDLMIVRLEATDPRNAMRTLLGYIATDVGSNVPLLLAIDASTAAGADSAAVILRATLGNALECAGDAEDGDTADVPLSLLYGPSARMSCLTARPLSGAAGGVFARVQVER